MVECFNDRTPSFYQLVGGIMAIIVAKGVS